ncbi:MAG: hypothetical protein FJ247_14040 [Nitrospira sp.]|nr:hypothetical protein [Nitrospira sp.]
MTGKLIYPIWRAGVSTLAIATIVGAGLSGSEDIVKQANDFGKGVALSIANSSTSGTVSEPEVRNMVVGPAHGVVHFGALESDSLWAESTSGSTFFIPST